MCTCEEGPPSQFPSETVIAPCPDLILFCRKHLHCEVFFVCPYRRKQVGWFRSPLALLPSPSGRSTAIGGVLGLSFYSVSKPYAASTSSSRWAEAGWGHECRAAATTAVPPSPPPTTLGPLGRARRRRGGRVGIGVCCLVVSVVNVP